MVAGDVEASIVDAFRLKFNVVEQSEAEIMEWLSSVAHEPVTKVVLPASSPA